MTITFLGAETMHYNFKQAEIFIFINDSYINHRKWLVDYKETKKGQLIILLLI